jgi:hypothetical protein
MTYLPGPSLTNSKSIFCPTFLNFLAIITHCVISLALANICRGRHGRSSQKHIIKKTAVQSAVMKIIHP